MNLSINGLRSSVNIQMLDALIRLHNTMNIFSVTPVQDVISKWSKRGKIRIEKCMLKVSNISAMCKVLFRINNKASRYWWGHSALYFELWTDNTSSNVSFDNFEQSIGQKLPIINGV